MTPDIETIIRRVMLDVICEVPDPFQSEEDGIRFYNQDLSDIGKAELADELKRVQLRLLIDRKSPPCLHLREEALKGLIYGARR